MVTQRLLFVKSLYLLAVLDFGSAKREVMGGCQPEVRGLDFASHQLQKKVLFRSSCCKKSYLNIVYSILISDLVLITPISYLPLTFILPLYKVCFACKNVIPAVTDITVSM